MSCFLWPSLLLIACLLLMRAIVMYCVWHIPDKSKHLYYRVEATFVRLDASNRMSEFVALHATTNLFCAYLGSGA